MIGTHRVAWFARLLLLGGLVVSGLTCDAFQPPTGGLPVAVSVSGDSIVSLQQTVRFTATATTSAGSAPGAAFLWRSTAPGVAKVDSTGTVTGQGRGRAWIYAELVTPDFLSGIPYDSAGVWVRFASVRLNRDTATVTAIGDTLLLQATGRNALGADAGAAGATWRSSNDSVATVSVDGAVIARRPGAVVITARADSLSATAQVTVRQVAAHIVFTNLRNDSLLYDALQVDSVIGVRVTDRRNAVMAGQQVTWTSSRPTVVAVQDAPTGRMRALLPDTATLTARVDTATSKVRVRINQVVTQVQVPPDSVQLDAVNDTFPLTAALLDRNARPVAGRSPTWVSRDITVATVDTAGRLVSRRDGRTKVIASVGAVTDSVVVTIAQVPTQVMVTPAAKTFIVLGDTASFAAALADHRGSSVSGRQPTWSSSDSAVATVSSLGHVRGVAEGRAEIRATVDAVVGSAAVRVGVPSTVVTSHSSLVLDAVGDTLALPAGYVLSGRSDTLIGLPVTWQSKDTTVVAVAPNGRIVSRREGATFVVVRYSNLRDSVAVSVTPKVTTVSVSPASRSLVALSDTVRFTATARDRRDVPVVGRSVRWSSADITKVTIDSVSGLARSVATGATTVAARVDSASGTAAVSVSQVVAAIDVQPDTATLLAVGATRAFTVAAVDARGNSIPSSGLTFTWSSAATGVVSVSPLTGSPTTATAAGFGFAYVKAIGGGRSDSSRVLVTVPYGTLALGRDTLTLTAIADTFRLGASATDITGGAIGTPLLSWTSSDTSVAAVAQTGTVTARREGPAVITVTGGTKQAAAAVTVRQVPTGVRISRTAPTFTALGDTFRLAAEAYDRRNYAIPSLADSVRWRAVNPEVASVDSLTGVVTTRARNLNCSSCYWGYASFIARVTSFESSQWQAYLQFTTKTVVLTPDTLRPTRLRADTVQTVFLDRLGNRAQTLASLSSNSWYSLASSDTSVAVVSVVDSTRVAVTGRRAGTARVILSVTGQQDTAQSRKLSDTLTVIVSPVVGGLLVSPDSVLLAAGDRLQLTATARDSGGAIIIGAPVTWTSADTGVVVVDATGAVTGTGAGTALVIASAGGVSDSVAVKTQTNLRMVYVDKAFTGTSTGSATQPYKTIAEGIAAALSGDVVRIRAGSYPQTGTLVIGKRLRLWGDGAATTTITGVSSADGIQVATSDSVEIRGLTVSGAGVHGLYVSGFSGSGPDLSLVDFTSSGNTRRGFYAVAPSRIRINGSAFHHNGDDGVGLTNQSTAAVLRDVLVEFNAGNGISLQKSRAELTRVTIGGTTSRTGDTRNWNGSALVALDTSVVRAASLTLRSDNATWGLVLDGASRMPLLSGSTIATYYHLYVTNGSGVDSLLDNTFSSGNTGSFSSRFYGSMVGQAAMLLRGNAFTTSGPLLEQSSPAPAAITMTGNVFRGVGNNQYISMSLGSTRLAVRGNRFEQASSRSNSTMLYVTGGAADTISGNEFVLSDGAGVYVSASATGAKLQLDSNQLRASSTTAGIGLYISGASASVSVRYNRLVGRFAPAIRSDNSQALTVRRNTIDSAQAGIELYQSQALVDSNTIRAGQYGVQLRGGSCTLSTCVVRGNSFSGLSDFGVKATATSAQAGASGNWWGDVSGPRDEDPSGTSFNPGGRGVPVIDGSSGVGRVQYEPWLVTEAEGGSPLVPVGAVSAVAMVAPASAPVLTALGDTVRFRAQARDAGNSLITGAAFGWVSSNPAVALVDGGNGLVRARANGAATITASAGGQSASLGMTVRQAVSTVDVVPDTATLAGIGQTQALAVQVRDRLGSAVDTSLFTSLWSTGNSSVVTVGGTSDLGATATGAGFGVGYVRVMVGSVGDSSRVVVTPTYGSVTLGRDTATLGAVGDTLRLSATATDMLGANVASPLLTWTSSDTAKVRVDQAGLVTARGQGTASVVVSGGFKADTAAVTVTQVPVALVITSVSGPDTLVVDAVNDTVQGRMEVRDRLGAVVAGGVARWRLLDTLVAGVDSVTGRVATRREGATGLLARSGVLADTVRLVVRQRVTQVAVTPANRTFAALTDTLTFQVAPKDRKGTVVAGRAVAWAVVDTGVIGVDPLTGLVTSRRNGTTTLRAVVDTVVGTASVAVTQVVAVADVQPDTATILVLNDTSRVFTAVARDARGVAVDSARYSVAWSTRNDSVLGVTAASGSRTRARSVAFGGTYVRAVVTPLSGAQVRDSSWVVVTPVYGSVTLGRDTATLGALQDTVRLSAGVTDTVGATVGSPLLTWASADTAVAIVAQTGRVTARTDGVVLVTVSGGTRQDTARITVRQAATSIGITRYPNTLTAYGDTFRLAAAVYDRRGYQIPRLADSLRWRTDNPSLVAVDSLSGLVVARGRYSGGNYRGYACGYVRVGFLEGGCMVGLEFQPWVNRVDIAVDTLRPSRLRADTIGVFLGDRNGNRAQTFTSLSSYSASAYSLTSSDTTVAVASVLDSTRVVVTTRKSGLARVVLSVGSLVDTSATRKTADTLVVVAAPVVASLIVSPDSTLLAVDDRLALTATARDSGSTVISGVRATWSSSDATIATVDSNGIVAGRASGTALVIASLGSARDTARVEVKTLSMVYVDSAYSGESTGSESRPWKTIALGVAAVPDGGVVRVRRGTYNEAVSIEKRLRLWGDSAAAVRIRPPSSNDGIRVTTSDTVEIRGLTVTGATYNGISIVGNLSSGPRVTVVDVVISGNASAGLSVTRPSALTVRGVTIQQSGDGIVLRDVTTWPEIRDVVVTGSTGYGILLERAQAILDRVTIGSTNYRSGDSRANSGSALVLDSSVARITALTLRNDNYTGSYSLVLRNKSRLTALSGSSISTVYQLLAQSGSGVDSLLRNTFFTGQYNTANVIQSRHADQEMLVVRGNTFNVPTGALDVSNAPVPVVVDSNVFLGRYSLLRLYGTGSAVVRGNRFTQSNGNSTPLVEIGTQYDSSHAGAEIVSNEFRSSYGAAVRFQVRQGELRLDSNDIGYSGSAAFGQSAVYVVSADSAVRVRFNRFSGPWMRAAQVEGNWGRVYVRRNTTDSAGTGFDIGTRWVLADSNSVRRGQRGVVLSSSYCTEATCVLAHNTFSDVTDYGVSVTQVAARVNAVNNWWGSSTGPRDEDASGIGFNPTGNGARVTDGASGNGQVRYQPWLTLEAEGGSPLVVVGSVGSVAIVAPATAPTLTALGDTLRFRAQVRDLSGALITGAAHRWQSSNPAVASVDGVTGLVTATGNGTATISAAAGGRSAELGLSVAQVVAVVDVQPNTAAPAGVGHVWAFTAVARDARGAAIDTSRFALTWTSTASEVLTVTGGSDVGASATGVAFGVGYVRAVAGNGLKDSVRVVVTPTYASLVLARDAATLYSVGDTVHLTAAVTDAAGAVASPLLTWTSSDTGKVLVDQAGVVTARGNGVAQVVVSGGFRADTAQVTVSQVAVRVAITSVSRPDTLAVDAVNDTVQAVGEARDALGAVVPGLAVTWQVGSTAVATVSGAGRVVTQGVGATRLVARYVRGPADTLADTVVVVVSQKVASVEVTPANWAFAALTDTLTLRAVARDRKGTVVPGRPVTWASADESIATVVPATGKVTSRMNGATSVRATVDDSSGTGNVTVSQALASADLQPDTATILTLNDSSWVFALAARDARGVALDTARYTVVWTAVSSSVMALGSNGRTQARLRSVGFGVSYLRAVVTSGVATRSDSSRVVVTAKYGTVALARDTATLTALTDTVRLVASVTDTVGGAIASPLLMWISSDTAVASVSQLGTVRARMEGVTRVTVAGGAKLDTATITVSQVPMGVRITRTPPTSWPAFSALGDTFRLAAEVYDRRSYAIPRLADSVRWRSDNPTNMSVDSLTGVVTSRARGLNCPGCYYGNATFYAQAAGYESGWNGYLIPWTKTVVFTPDTLRPTRLRADTVETRFLDRLGNRAQTLLSVGYSLSSRDTSIAVVSVVDSTRVVVTGKRAGTARVILTVTSYQDTAQSRKLSDTLTVMVTPVPAVVIASVDSTLLTVGDRFALSAVTRDSGGTVIPGQRIVWTRLDTLVGVDSLGVVTGQVVGLGRVVATAGDVADTVPVAVQNLSVVYVDAAYLGTTSTGSATQPFKTIAEGDSAVILGGVVRVRAGTYNGTVVIGKRLRLWGDGSGSTIIRASAYNDGIRVATSDTVDIRGFTIVGPTSGTNYDGINAVGDTLGARLAVTDVIVRNHAGRGLAATSPTALQVTGSAFRNNGMEGVNLLGAAAAATFSSVVVEGNAGNGILLQKSRANLVNVTIGSTSSRANDSREYNGWALVALDTSVVRVTNATLRSDNASWGVVLDRASRMPLLTGSAISTAYHLNVVNGSGVDSIFNNTFTSSQCCGNTSNVASGYASQPSLTVRGNTFNVTSQALNYTAPVPLVVEGNLFTGDYYVLNWNTTASVTVRANQFVNSTRTNWLLQGVGGPATVVGNTITVNTANVLYLESSSVVRVDSNQVQSTGTSSGTSIYVTSPSSSVTVRNNRVQAGSGSNGVYVQDPSSSSVTVQDNWLQSTSPSASYAVYVNSGYPVVVSYNTIVGGWSRGLYTGGSGALTFRRNTVDSVAGALDLSQAQVTIDSNRIRNGTFGVQLRSGGCTTTSCVLSQNSLSGLADFGLKATVTSAQVLATGNWWGHLSGPRDSDPTGFAVNSSGTGVRVYDGTLGYGRADYRSWLTAEPATVGSPGVAPAPLLVRAPAGPVVVGGALPQQER